MNGGTAPSAGAASDAQAASGAQAASSAGQGSTSSPVPGASPTVSRRRLGQVLRELRTSRGLTADEVSRQMERSDSWLSRIETGRSGLHPHELRPLLDLLGLDDVERRVGLEALARHGRQRGWWSRYVQDLTTAYPTYIGFEAEASCALAYAALVVPGLLQTEGYAQAVARSILPLYPAVQAQRTIEVRLQRQRRLHEEEQPLQLRAILDESVLLRRFGGREVMRGQLQHLLDLPARRPQVNVQIIPLDAPVHPNLTAGFTVLTFPAPEQPVAMTESVAGHTIEDGPVALRHLEVFNELSTAACNPTDSAAVLRRILGRID